MPMASLIQVPSLNSEVLNYAPREFKADQHLQPYPDYLWLIQQGMVKTYSVQEDGYFTTLGYWGQGDVVGKPLQVHGYCEMLCVSTVVAQCVPIHASPELMSALISQMGRTQKLLAIQGLKTIKQRLQQGFLWLADNFGQRTQTGCHIHLSITHEEIAELIGTTRVTVTRYLKELTNQGLLIRRQQKYTLTPLAMDTKCWFDDPL